SIPRSMTMCHGQLNSTDLRSRAPGSGVYRSGGGPPNCAYAATERTVASVLASATRVALIAVLLAMFEPPDRDGHYARARYDRPETSGREPTTAVACMGIAGGARRTRQGPAPAPNGAQYFAVAAD